MAEARDTDIQLDQNVEGRVTKEMEEMIEHCGDGLLVRECCIYRVPIILRQLKEEAFTPKVISIGRFHYGGNERLQDMESHKQILFKRFIQRSKSSLEDLVCFVKDLVPKVRASYSETINLTEEQLVKLTLTDAAFIIEFFIGMGMNELLFDVKLSQPWLVDSIVYDLLLLENQLPFFVIEELFNKAFLLDGQGSLPSFLSLVLRVFVNYAPKLEPDPEWKINHFTDLLRLSYLPGKMSAHHSYSEVQGHTLRYNANALKKAGIRLEASKSECLLDLKFSGHVFKIPQISVDGHTEILFRNMIALEQCHYPYASCITDYAIIMDCLVDTDSDVDILVDKKIVINNLGDSFNVALLFNGLSKNVLHKNFNNEDLYIICKMLNAYCEDPRNTPWRTAVSIGGIILLLLTVVQTIFSILQVVLKKKI